MNSDQSSPDSVSAALIDILRDDLNIDVSRVTQESRLVDDVGLDSVAFAVGMVAIEDKLGVAVSEQELLGCDTVADAWTRHPWSQVHARAEGIATHILDQPQPGAVGLVGEPTADCVAAIQATWLAGRSVSILPGPVRGADPQQWARATLTRFAGLGVRTVLSHGAELGLLSGVDGPLKVLDLGAVAHEPSTGFTLVGAAAETPALLQGTAGSTGNPRTVQLPAEAVLNNVNGLLSRFDVDPAVDVGCTWLPLYHDMGLTFLLSGMLTGAPMWLAPTSAFTASPFRWLRWLTESGASLTAAP